MICCQHKSSSGWFNEREFCINCTEPICYMDEYEGLTKPCPILKTAKEEFLKKKREKKKETQNRSQKV